MFQKYKKNEILNHIIAKTVGHISIVLAILLICLFIVKAYLSTALSENTDTYIIIVSRIPIFYLGSIVTMSVYIYTKTYSMSTIQFASPVTSLMMGIGVIFSFLSMITLPSKLYYPLPFFQDYIKLILNSTWNWQMFLGLLNIISFLIATTVFVITLIRFISSFNIDAILKKNYIAVAKICGIKEKQNKQNKQYIIEPFLEKELVLLEKNLNIFNQNLLYLLTLNNEKLTEKYILKWIDAVSNTQERIFHSPIKDSITHKKLYDKTLELTNKLIVETSDNITLSRYHEILLKGIFNSIPLFELEEKSIKNIKEEKIKEIQTNYTENYDLLSKTCYTELNKIIEYLYRNQKSSDILQKMSSNNGIDFLGSTVNQSKFISEKANLEINDKNNYMEDLLIGMLFNIINKNNNVDLPVVLSLLFKVQQETNTNEIKTDSLSSVTAGVFEDLGNAIEGIREKQDLIQESKFLQAIEDAEAINDELPKVTLNDKTISYIIIGIIKANEIENYKAVGYLIKRLCNHLSISEILKNLDVLEGSIYDNGYRELHLSKISLNEYSLKYCFNKTKILLFLQSYANKSEIFEEYRNIINIEYKADILETLQDKHKEYNMSCIKGNKLDNLKEKKENKIGFI
ncbi:hypothetical protein [Exiguobacterium sp.]|uniref:hypothetical protein n=1 Tax=Exiguobacterium sp. TaxID=44751 RepID=UPI00263B9563|nr:hypothetical protein [Exiguobacterium sp.]MCC5891340.1 hypothetical protein [Exiguobacterium sp.]